MIVRAHGKLNLSLDILGKTPDGYHDLRMVMQSVEFGDDLDVQLRDDGRFTLDPGKLYLPADGRNLAIKAARLFLDGTGLGADIRVTKRIPVCAGMGGGSADAAAVLRALNRLTGRDMPVQELCQFGLKIGSDVPFCVMEGAALAEGRGEKLTPLPPLADCAIVICKPAFAMSTPELFVRSDSRKSRLRPDTAGLVDALEAGDIPGVARRMYNVFEDVLDRRQSAIPAIKASLMDMGATGAVMTGSGSAVFGLFTDENAAQAAYTALSARYRECCLTRPCPAAEV